jgi:hypothetical protein
MKKNIKLALLLLLICVPTFTQALSISRPDKTFFYEMQPGDEITQKIILTNTGNKEQVFKLYGADGASTLEGNLAAKQSNQKQENIGLWLNFEQNNVTLQANETKEINYTIKIPATTPPGSYAGGIAAEEIPTAANAAEKLNSANGMGLVSVMRFVLPIYVKIPGEKITDYQWNDFSYSQDPVPIFYLKLQNKGNAIIKINGYTEIINTNENYQQTQETEEKSYYEKSQKVLQPNIIEHHFELLTNQELNVPVKWTEPPLYGNFKAKTVLTFSEYDLIKGKQTVLQTLEKEINFSIVPWSIIKQISILLIIILGFIAITLIFIKRYHKQLIKHSTNYTVAAGDTLEKIAETQKINWKKIAKINNLAPPYSLKAGTIILLPPKKNG